MILSMERFLTLGEAAQFLGLSKQRLSQLYAAGKLPEPDAVVGKRVAWKEESLKKWAKNRQS